MTPWLLLIVLLWPSMGWAEGRPFDVQCLDPSLTYRYQPFLDQIPICRPVHDPPNLIKGRNPRYTGRPFAHTDEYDAHLLSQIRQVVREEIAAEKTRLYQRLNSIEEYDKAYRWRWLP